MDALANTPCPDCGGFGLRAAWLVSTRSRAVVPLRVMWLVCDCGFAEEGERVGPKYRPAVGDSVRICDGGETRATGTLLEHIGGFAFVDTDLDGARYFEVATWEPQPAPSTTWDGAVR